MRFGVPLATTIEMMPAVAAAAEAVGCDSVWLPEHLVWPVAMEASYPYTLDGRPPVAPDLPTFDPWVLLAWVAGQTHHIRLGTSVYILPLRNPHVTARAVTTLDCVSGGRAILGAGLGWMPEEFAIAEQEFATRGARASEIATILRALWSAGPAEHDGRHYHFPPIHFEPKPPQGARLPIIFGGESEPALRRAARDGERLDRDAPHTSLGSSERRPAPRPAPPARS
jgi:probable F420-dependent oxidoreductase